MSKMVSFIREVRAELGKVTWPKRDDLVGAVIIVCLLSIAFAIVIGLMDMGVSRLVQWMIR